MHSVPGMVSLLWSVMREWLGRAVEQLNRWESHAVAPSTVLPPDEPAPELTGLTTAARDGLL